MKKVLLVLFAIIASLSIFSSCSDDVTYEVQIKNNDDVSIDNVEIINYGENSIDSYINIGHMRSYESSEVFKTKSFKIKIRFSKYYLEDGGYVNVITSNFYEMKEGEKTYILLDDNTPLTRE